MDRRHKIYSIKRKGHQKGTPGAEGDLQENNQLPVQMIYGHICGSICQMQRKKKAKQKLAIEKPKIGNARQLRGILFIEPDDEEFQPIMKAARRKWEVPMPAAIPCKIPMKSSGETHRNMVTRKTKYACVVDADETTRPRLEGAGHKPHQDHITAKRTNSMTSHSLVDKFIPMPQAMKMPDAKAAVEKERDKLEKVPSWQLTKVRNKKDVINESRNKGREVRSASLMDLCHLKNSELEPQNQKYKGRVVLQSRIVKDDSGAYAEYSLNKDHQRPK